MWQVCSKGVFAGHASWKKPDPLIGLSVITCDKTKQWKFSWKTLGFGWERFQTSEKENNNLDKDLNIDNLP